MQYVQIAVSLDSYGSFKAIKSSDIQLMVCGFLLGFYSNQVPILYICERPFLKRFALCCRSVVCLSVLSVCL